MEIAFEFRCWQRLATHTRSTRVGLVKPVVFARDAQKSPTWVSNRSVLKSDVSVRSMRPKVSAQESPHQITGPSSS